MVAPLIAAVPPARRAGPPASAPRLRPPASSLRRANTRLPRSKVGGGIRRLARDVRARCTRHPEAGVRYLSLPLISHFISLSHNPRGEAHASKKIWGIQPRRVFMLCREACLGDSYCQRIDLVICFFIVLSRVFLLPLRPPCFPPSHSARRLRT